MNYSVAIRTLGKSHETLLLELDSISRQTVLPDKVVIYIAVGYPQAPYNVMGEVYVETPKGMVSQRAMDYAEIDSDLILVLDDDVELAENSAEILIRELELYNADCVAADTFQHHKMPITSKIKAALSNFVFPRFNQRWAFKLHSNGSFSYINNPVKSCYPSQSAAGPAALWRKNSLVRLDFKAETWLDRLGFAYGDDDLEFYKLYVNGGRLFVSFDCGVQNLDAKTASSDFHKDSQRFYTRTMSNHVRWYRMQFQTRCKGLQRWSASASYTIKLVWLTILHLVLCLQAWSFIPMKYHLKGLRDAHRYVSSDLYREIPAYKNENTVLR